MASSRPSFAVVGRLVMHCPGRHAPFFTPITPCQSTFYVQGLQGSTLEFFPTQSVDKNTFQLFRKHDGASIESPLVAFLTLENKPNKD